MDSLLIMAVYTPNWAILRLLVLSSLVFLLISNLTNGLRLHQFLGTKTTEANKSLKTDANSAKLSCSSEVTLLLIWSVTPFYSLHPSTMADVCYETPQKRTVSVVSLYLLFGLNKKFRISKSIDEKSPT